MLNSRIVHWFGIGCIAVLTVSSADAGERQAVIELFTSQGCSSCPPADKLLGELGKDASLITLSLPINYWDYLGWKDTLALPGHAARQRGYARERRDRQVYTPQAVINGVMHAIGSDKAAIEAAVVKSMENPETMAVPVEITADKNQLSVRVAAMDVPMQGEVWLCGVKRATEVHIGRGENRGKTIVYHNVVRGWHKLGEWTGKSVSWQLPLSDFKAGIDEAAAIVQEHPDGNPGRVLGAALITLH